MKCLEYIGFRFLTALFFILPFPILYLFSDFVYFLLYKLIKYRRKIVFDNLSKCFPDKSEAEINKICRAFYHHLSDITLESIKGMTISLNTLSKRYRILNTEIADKYFDNDKSILCFTSHYGNWEYGILATNNVIKHQAIALYLPLTNKYSERYGVKRRSRFGTKLVAVQDTKKVFTEPQPQPLAVILAADQNPSNVEKAIWVNFLNRDTACLHGPEAYAKKTNFPVVYLKISKPKRGYYTLEFEELISNPADCHPNKITEIYIHRLEKDIVEKPEYWLWSHRRWKHSRD
jgi:KDO2-lipid IV(A) lauroyltransferase